MIEPINKSNILNFKSDTLANFKNIFSNVWIKIDNNIILNNKIDWINQIKLLKNINEITFLYLELDIKELTSKFLKDFIKEEKYWKDIWNCSYLVLFIKNESWIMIYWVDILNKVKIKISSFKIDIDWFEDYKTLELKYRNRTLNEQLNNLNSLLENLFNDFKIERKMVGHNVRVKGVENFKGIVSRSNYSEFFTDLSPAFNFDKIKEIIWEKKEYK